MAGFPRLSTRNGTFLLFFLLQFVFTLAQDEPQCSATKPCAKGCCSKWGFCGYGKDSCAKDVCVNNCDQKAECDPGGFGREFVQIDKCPLNVCCSTSGFCGYTEEFCGQNKIDPPKCSSHSLQRVVGYYEGWSKNRICNKFMPEQIPLGVYTHLNYAFATIDPETFQVRLASSTENDIYERLTMLKEMDPDLKVLIAIGGWTFNDPGPTETTFSDIARSEANQKAFIKSLVSFLSTYNFDGIDLDWEYPKAKDRSGRDEDFETFPKFLANIKSALKSTGRDELSITLPASYWYLQNFDLGKIEPHVDFFNIMSYDLHGTWDKGNEWVGPYLNAHTNLTEIKEAMNLLWRNNVSPDKVVLGTGFYGRAFTATSPDCLEPGCTYESGAPRQECSNEISVMMNSEIMDVISRTNASPKLDKEAAVKILTFDNNNWVAYDDEETLKMKADFAREQCLSGIMVWAVSHDVEDGRFSKAIGEAAGRKFTSIPIRGGMTMIEIDSSTSNQTETKHAQCKWTDCGQSCPANWIRVMRKDSGARKNEQMIDGSRCPSGVHELCCPPEGDLPTCGWYTHNNGKCDHTCPDGTFEIGSINKFCSNSNGYQSACCTKGSSNTKLYEPCSWTDGPDCDDHNCASGLDKVVLSSMGSGGASCSPRQLSFQDWQFEYEERKYCCKREENHKWDDCQMYNNLGPGPSDDETFCRSGCPSDRVRVALDPLPNRPDKRLACMRGAKAHCCIPKSSTFTKRESPEDAGLRGILDAFVEAPFCYAAGSFMDTGAAGTAGTGASKRSDGYHHQHQHGHARHKHQHGHTHHPHAKRTLQRRDAEYDSDTIIELVRDLLKSTATSNEKAIWDDTIGKKYPNLVWSKLAAYITKTKKISTWGVNKLSDLIVCNLSQWNRWVGDDKEELCPCDTAYCCPGGGEECGSENADEVSLDRRSLTPWEDFDIDEGDEADVSHLERRFPGDPRPYRIYFPDGTYITIWSEEYIPKSNAWPRDHEIWRSAWIPNNGAGCNSAMPDRVSTDYRTTGINVEHIIELNTIARFFTLAMAGRLPSNRTSLTPRLSTSLVRETLLAEYRDHVVVRPFANGFNTRYPVRRLFTHIGSINNDAPFVLLNSGMNQIKTSIWTGKVPSFAYGLFPNNVRTLMMDYLTTDINPPERFPINDEFLNLLRLHTQTVNYMGYPEVWARLIRMNENIRVELSLLETAHYENTGIRDHVVDAWDEFIRDQLEFTLANAQRFVQNWVTTGEGEYQDYVVNSRVVEFIQGLRSLLRDNNSLKLSLDDLPGKKGPRDPDNPDGPVDPEDPDNPDTPEDPSSG